VRVGIGTRRWWSLLLVAAAAAAFVGLGCGGSDGGARNRPDLAATVVREEPVGPRLLDLTIRSPALGTDAKARLMTPIGWRKGRAARRWPVLYLLHGCCDTYQSWTRSTSIERFPALRRVLVVMPEGGAVGFYSDWVGNGSEPGPGWETFHLVELRRLLERDYGAGTRRAIAGLSMGGLGAIAYAARHRGLFGAAASFSGLLHPLQDADDLLGLFGNYTDDPRAVWGDPVDDRARWARHDPTELAARLRGTPLFVSSGNGRRGPLDASAGGEDPIEITVFGESRAFVARLRRLRVPVHADFYGPGTHSWPYWQRELRRALPTLMHDLGAPRP
jgi:diacylglycerol O-acyltransferase/trehalose O-mycolyltransferase